MMHKYNSPRIFFPKTVSETLEMTHAEQNAIFWAGGTFLSLNSKRTLISLPRNVIVLGQVEELSRASRSELTLEIGAMMTLDRLASIGRDTLPPGLYDAITQIFCKPIRCRATVGGHLAITNQTSGLKSLLHLLDTTVEIKYLRKRRGRRKAVLQGKTIPVAQLEEKTGLSANELISKICIPAEPWDFGMCRKIFPTPGNEQVLIFTALARREKEVLTELRMAFSNGLTGVMRDRNMEIDMAGRPLPLNPRDLEFLDKAVDAITLPWKNREYEKVTAKKLARFFVNHARR